MWQVEVWCGMVQLRCCGKLWCGGGEVLWRGEVVWCGEVRRGVVWWR